jgi:hypothetical protein
VVSDASTPRIQTSYSSASADVARRCIYLQNGEEYDRGRMKGPNIHLFELHRENTLGSTARDIPFMKLRFIPTTSVLRSETSVDEMEP